MVCVFISHHFAALLDLQVWQFLTRNHTCKDANFGVIMCTEGLIIYLLKISVKIKKFGGHVDVPCVYMCHTLHYSCFVEVLEKFTSAKHFANSTVLHGGGS